jgi:large subunit ribosomal protein L23
MTALLPTDVIRKPLITEKATFASGEFNRYAFEVDRRATKKDIAAAVAELYKVRVVSVATMNRKGQRRRTRFGFAQQPTVKRALVKVHPEDKIELF